jgi:hypothetical protein
VAGEGRAERLMVGELMSGRVGANQTTCPPTRRLFPQHIVHSKNKR